MAERAAGLWVLTAAFLDTMTIRGNAPPKDLKPIAILISLGIFCLELDQALPNTDSSLP